MSDIDADVATAAPAADAVGTLVVDDATATVAPPQPPATTARPTAAGLFDGDDDDILGLGAVPPPPEAIPAAPRAADDDVAAGATAEESAPNTGAVAADMVSDSVLISALEDAIDSVAHREAAAPAQGDGDEEYLPAPVDHRRRPPPPPLVPDGATLASLFGAGFKAPTTGTSGGADDEDAAAAPSAKLVDPADFDALAVLEQAFGSTVAAASTSLLDIQSPRGPFLKPGAAILAPLEEEEHLDEITDLFGEHGAACVRQIPADSIGERTEILTARRPVDPLEKLRQSVDGSSAVVDGSAAVAPRDVLLVEMPTISGNRQIMHSEAVKYDPSTAYVKPSTSRAFYTPFNTIRWAESSTPGTPLSNARLVYWKGRTGDKVLPPTLHIGPDVYEIVETAGHALQFVSTSSTVRDAKLGIPHSALIESVIASKQVTLRAAADVPNSVTNSLGHENALKLKMQDVTTAVGFLGQRAPVLGATKEKNPPKWLEPTLADRFMEMERKNREKAAQERAKRGEPMSLTEMLGLELQALNDLHQALDSPEQLAVLLEQRHAAEMKRLPFGRSAPPPATTAAPGDGEQQQQDDGPIAPYSRDRTHRLGRSTALIGGSVGGADDDDAATVPSHRAASLPLSHHSTDRLSLRSGLGAPRSVASEKSASHASSIGGGSEFSRKRARPLEAESDTIQQLAKPILADAIQRASARLESLRTAQLAIDKMDAEALNTSREQIEDAGALLAVLNAAHTWITTQAVSRNAILSELKSMSSDVKADYNFDVDISSLLAASA